jgi:xanthine dehydrogenase small subunit
VAEGTTSGGTIRFTLDGVDVGVDVPDAASGSSVTLLDALRGPLGVRSVKDGCSPQGQCGCCTVLVDGQPRVACVTPLARIAGRRVATVDGLDGEFGAGTRARWCDAFSAAGASQCGFCTPGILVRLAATDARSADIGRPLLAHLCRCTGWQTIVEAVTIARSGTPVSVVADARGRARAAIEGRTPQMVGADAVLGRGGFAADTAPVDALVALRSDDGAWVVGADLVEARALVRRTQGRRSTIAVTWPLELPPGPWDRVLRTTWVEPAYLETDATWCAPGGEPAPLDANGGAFGGKVGDPLGLGAVARELADRHGRAVLVLAHREDVVRRGPKRPPVAAGVRADGSGVVRVAVGASTPRHVVDEWARAFRSIAPDIDIEPVTVAGPPVASSSRAAGWAEAAVLLASLGAGPDTVRSPDGGRATALIADDGMVQVEVACGDPLDRVVLRSYAIGAAHMALGWVRSEALRVDGAGVVQDLTVRSFGVLRAVDMPHVDVRIVDDDGPAVNGSDAVFVAVAAAAWRASGHAPDWPITA